MSYLLTGSFAKQVQIVESRRYVLLGSEESFLELEGLKDRRKIRRAVPEMLFLAFIAQLRTVCTMVKLRGIPPVSRDPKDDHWLALAAQGKAGILVAGDKDLLVLKQHTGTRILSPSAFLKEVGAQF